MAGGHITKELATITYASIVCRERVKIALMIVSLNGLEVKLGDILNASVQTLITEKVWTS